MGAEWHCYKFEFPLMRGSIYYHGLGKSKNDLGLFTLTEAALKGHNVREKIPQIILMQKIIMIFKELIAKENLQKIKYVIMLTNYDRSKSNSSK